jgi:hypothetical protein
MSVNADNPDSSKHRDVDRILWLDSAALSMISQDSGAVTRLPTATNSKCLNHDITQGDSKAADLLSQKSLLRKSSSDQPRGVLPLRVCNQRMATGGGCASSKCVQVSLPQEPCRTAIGRSGCRNQQRRQRLRNQYSTMAFCAAVTVVCLADLGTLASVWCVCYPGWWGYEGMTTSLLECLSQKLELSQNVSKNAPLSTAGVSQ